MKKKILVVGSIADFGGREVEVNNIIEGLCREYDIMLFSTVTITEKSMAVSRENGLWSSLHKELYHSSFFLKVMSLLNKKWNRSSSPAYLLVSNKISCVFFNFDIENKHILKKKVISVDAVLFCGVFTNGYLKEIINYCLELEKPFLFRTTGTINEIPLGIKELLPKISSLLVHSHSNATFLSSMNLNNISIVDQTTLAENSLLEIVINQSNNLVYGYIGRFSNEKGIVELLNIFKKLKKRLIIAGNGPLLGEVENSCANNSFIDYIGEIQANKIADFFKKIDVLIIPSFEESGPLVGIEAMAAGKIILSTKVGAMVDRLSGTNNQFWFDINDNKTLIDCIFKLEQLHKDVVNNIREELREVYKNNYSKKRISEQYLEEVHNCFKVN